MVCPRCGGMALRAVEGSNVSLYCPSCRFVPESVKPPRPPRKKTPLAPRVEVVPEPEIVKSIYDALTFLGYRVLRVGQRRADLSGSDAGVPDLLVTGDWNRLPMWLGMEVKVPVVGRLSRAQKQLHALGLIVVVFGVDDAIRFAEEYLGVPPQNLG